MHNALKTITNLTAVKNPRLRGVVNLSRELIIIDQDLVQVTTISRCNVKKDDDIVSVEKIIWKLGVD